MRKSLFTKIFFTQIVVNLVVLMLIIPTLFFAIGAYFVDAHREPILQDAPRVARMGTQIADMGGDEKTWDFFRSGIEFVSGRNSVIVTNAEGDIIASPRNSEGVDLSKINKNFIKSAAEGRTMIAL